MSETDQRAEDPPRDIGGTTTEDVTVDRSGFIPWARERGQTATHRVGGALAGVADNAVALSAAVLVAATLLAIIWVNSPIGGTYDEFWHIEAGVLVGPYDLVLDLKHWVNDGLMALFFFAVGLEVKRELTIGELTDRRRAAVPIVAAVAGLAVPAVIFLAFNAVCTSPPTPGAWWCPPTPRSCWRCWPWSGPSPAPDSGCSWSRSRWPTTSVP